MIDAALGYVDVAPLANLSDAIKKRARPSVAGACVETAVASWLTSKAWKEITAANRLPYRIAR